MQRPHQGTGAAGRGAGASSTPSPPGDFNYPHLWRDSEPRPPPPLETSRTPSCLLLAYTDQACVTTLAYQCLGKPDVSL